MVHSLLWSKVLSIAACSAILANTEQAASASCSSASCGVAVSPFWTNSSQITFNFTGFTPEADLQFRWGLGTTPGTCDTVSFTPFTGQQIPRAEFIANGDLLQGVTVFQEDHSLVNSSLTEGQIYFVTVQALNSAGTVLAQATSAAVKVDSTPPMLSPGGFTISSEGCSQPGNPVATHQGPNSMWICWGGFKDAQSDVATYSYQLFAVQPVPKSSSSRKLLADQPSTHANGLSSWKQSLLSRLQQLFWQVSSCLTMLFSMLHLFGFNQITSLAHPHTALDNPSATTQLHARSLLQSPAVTPLIAVTTVDASTAPAGQVLPGLKLQPGRIYYAEVTATNNAALNASSATTFSTASKPSNRSLLIAIVVLASIGVSMLLVALLTAFIVRRRLVRRQEETRAQRGQMKQLKGLMHGLVNVTGDPQKQQLDAIRNARELAFLITDLQDSTAMAAANAAAFRKVQDIHDTLLHEGIAKYSGYEINTEGDSFHIAFTSVAAAVQVAMETQVRLLDSDWPKDVLKLPACGQEKDNQGEKVFRGPRVRMGIHWAVEGTVANRLHLVTKHRVFSGPGFLLAQELGDSASGGQVLLSHDAWLNLRHNMCDAGFPQVEQLGMYKLEAWPAPFWIYQVSHQLGRPLNRKFQPLRKIEFMEQGWGLNIAPPPEPRPPRNLLTFVACRLFLPRGALRLPKAVANSLYQILAVVAQQFEGYIFTVNIEEGRCMLTFAKTVDAVRFCHAAQTNILYHRWPPEALDMSGSIEVTPDGRLLFKGPRIAMAVHETADYDVEVHVTEPMLMSQRDDAVVYRGEGEKFARRLSKVIHGGQVVLSETAWASIQDQIPGQSQIISLGSHSIDADFEQAVLLMEVMPSLLAKRHFDPLNTLHQLEPGYRDSPEPSENMAIVFVKVAKPDEVKDAEQASSPVSDDTILRIITAFNVGVGKYTKLVRRLLPKYAGYECKEPESGKFTLSFRLLEDAVRWCSAVQKELLVMSWPDALMQWGDCREQRDPATGNIIWRGLRVRMGMAFGRPSYKKPLNTGRADYFGNLPNLAARVMALAAPGQILLEGYYGFGPEAKRGPDDLTALLPQRPSRIPGEPDHEAIEVLQLGKFPIKGLDDPKLIFQCLPLSLAGRTFSLASSAERPGDTSLKRLKLGTSLVSGEDSPARSLIVAARANSRLLTSFFGMITRSSSRATDTRPLQTEGARRTGSTIILPSPRELELVRSHNSQVVPGAGAAPPPAYAPPHLNSMTSLAQAVINRVRGIRAGQGHSPRTDSGTSPRSHSGKSRLSMLSRTMRQDSCPQTPLTGAEPSQDPSASLEAYPTLGRGGPPPVRVPQSRMGKHRSASEGEDSPDSHAGSDSREGQGLPVRDSPSSHRLQHSHSDLSPNHSLASASMSPVFEQYLQQQAQAPGLPQTRSRHSRSVTADQLSWPRGVGGRGQEGGGGRRSDWAGMGIPQSSELDLTFPRLKVDVSSQAAPSESADSTGSAGSPNTVFAQELAQLYVSGRHPQLRDSSRFGSFEGARTMPSQRALQQGPTPSLPSSESIGPQHTYSLPPDLQSAPALAAHRLGIHPPRPQPPLASAQTLPAARLTSLSQSAYSDSSRLAGSSQGVPDVQPHLRDNRLFVPSSSHREARSGHQRTGSIETLGGHMGHVEMHPEASEPSWASETGSTSRRAFNVPHLAVHFEGDEVVEISDISTMLDSDHHLERV